MLCFPDLNMQTGTIISLPSENSAFTRTSRSLKVGDMRPTTPLCVNLFNRTSADYCAVKTLFTNTITNHRNAFWRRWDCNLPVATPCVSSCGQDCKRGDTNLKSLLPIYDWVPIDKPDEEATGLLKSFAPACGNPFNVSCPRPDSPVPFLSPRFQESRPGVNGKSNSTPSDAQNLWSPIRDNLEDYLTPPTSPEKRETDSPPTTRKKSVQERTAGNYARRCRRRRSSTSHLSARLRHSIILTRSNSHSATYLRRPIRRKLEFLKNIKK